MGETTVRSPHSLERGDFHAQRGISPGAYSSPSNTRPDGGHIAGHVGKGGGQAVRRDTPPVVGGQRNVIEDR
jgi:hypothetical protein